MYTIDTLLSPLMCACYYLWLLLTRSDFQLDRGVGGWMVAMHFSGRWQCSITRLTWTQSFILLHACNTLLSPLICACYYLWLLLTGSDFQLDRGVGGWMVAMHFSGRWQCSITRLTWTQSFILLHACNTLLSPLICACYYLWLLLTGSDFQLDRGVGGWMVAMQWWHYGVTRLTWM